MLDLAIIGAGMMGANHARVARGIPSARVVLVVDPHEERARALAEPLGAEWSVVIPSTHPFDAAVVAVPTPLHAEIGVALLRAGIHVLVEKPIADTIDAAEKLVEAAAESATVLMVGHIEQFNTAILELERIVHSPVHIQADRVSPFSERVHDGVIFDLMIHDLDIVRRIAASPVVQIEAMARQVRSDTEDYASALLRFESGLTATITASRVGQQKIRRIEVTEKDDFISVDLLRQDVTVQRVNHSEYFSSDGPRYRQSGVIEIPFLEHRGEPLALELQHFVVECIGEGQHPRVSGIDGLESLRLATQVALAAGVSVGGNEEVPKLRRE